MDIYVFACQGIEPCQANADAGTRRLQVRMRPPIRLFNHSPHIVFRLAERPSVFKFEGRHGRGELTCLVG